jgi:GNAT superfamily N-acetyltransferase
MQINFKIVEGSFIEKFPVLSNMFIEHWKEVAKNRELMKISADLEKYKAMEQSGNLVSLFAIKNEEIIGYSVNILSPHLHYKELITAYNDLLFLDRKHRKTSLGGELILKTEEVCKGKGAKLMLFHAKENTSLAKILPRKSYNTHEIIFSKEL